MNKPIRHFMLSALLCLLGSFAAAAQDVAATWNSLVQPALDANRQAMVENVALQRDRIHITLIQGTIQFSQPAEGLVFGAAFRGRGRIQVAPPNPLETQQLKLFIDRDTLDMEFSEAVFGFTDSTFQEFERQVKWTTAADSRLAELYSERQQARENAGAELVPRMFKSLFSADRKLTALFFADLKTQEKGWIHARFDALQLEEVTLGRWAIWPGGFKGFDSWLSFPAGDRSASQAFRDPLAREDFHIRGHRIDVTVTASAELSSTSQANVEYRMSGERVLLFVLDANLRVESVKDSKGDSLPFFQPREPKDRMQSYGDYVAVVLPQPTEVGQSQTLVFRYGGKRVIRKVGTGNYFCQSYGWYPTRPDSFATRADFELTFHSPKKYSLVATGNKLNESTVGDWTVSTWKSDLPLAVAGFAFGDFKHYLEKAGEVDVEVYANKEPDDFMTSIQNLFEPQTITGSPTLRPWGAVGTLTPAAMAQTTGTEMSNTLRLFEKYFGPYPYKRLAVVNIPYPYGQGWPMLLYLSMFSFLDSTQRHYLGLREEAALPEAFRAHESSHQWWGHRVGWKSYHDQWLSEGFAQFSGNLYVQFRENEKEYLNRLRQDKKELLFEDEKGHIYEPRGPVWMGLRLSSSESVGAYQTVIYKKGGFILHMLRRMLWNPMSNNPEQRFMAMMHEFCNAFHNKPASTEDFKAVAEKFMLPVLDLDGNRRLDWFFRQYVYGTGVPTYELSYQVEEAEAGKWKVNVTVQQSHVPSGWKDILSLYIQSPARTGRIGLIQVVQPITKISFVLPSKPEKLTLNNNEDTLAHIKQ